FGMYSKGSRNSQALQSSVLFCGSGGWSLVLPEQVTGNGPLVALAGLTLFPCMGQSADRARQDKQSAAEWRGKTQLREDHTGCAVDIHWNSPSFTFCKNRFNRSANGGKLS